MDVRLRNHCSHRKPISVTCCECVSVALFAHLAKQLCRIMLTRVAFLPVILCSTFFYIRHQYRKVILNMKCVIWYSLQSFLGYVLF